MSNLCDICKAPAYQSYYEAYAELDKEGARRVKGKKLHHRCADHHLKGENSKLPLPAGLVLHCDKCNLVIPSDAPRHEANDCEFVSLHRLAYYEPYESLAGQHAMAVGAWMFIHDKALREVADPTCIRYSLHYKTDRKNHFDQSAIRKAMTAEQVLAASEHERTPECVQDLPYMHCPHCRDKSLYR